jgi:hypothetical protein
MYQHMNLFSYQTTPGSINDGGDMDTAQYPDDKYKQVTNYIQNLSEPKKNMFNCE